MRQFWSFSSQMKFEMLDGNPTLDLRSIHWLFASSWKHCIVVALWVSSKQGTGRPAAIFRDRLAAFSAWQSFSKAQARPRQDSVPRLNLPPRCQWFSLANAQDRIFVRADTPPIYLLCTSPLAAHNNCIPETNWSSCFFRIESPTAQLDSKRRVARRKTPPWISTSKWTSTTSSMHQPPRSLKHILMISSPGRSRFELATLFSSHSAMR